MPDQSTFVIEAAYSTVCLLLCHFPFSNHRNRVAVNGLARRYQSSVSQSTVEVNGYKVSGLPTLTVSFDQLAPHGVKEYLLQLAIFIESMSILTAPCSLVPSPESDSGHETCRDQEALVLRSFDLSPSGLPRLYRLLRRRRWHQLPHVQSRRSNQSGQAQQNDARLEHVGIADPHPELNFLLFK